MPLPPYVTVESSGVSLDHSSQVPLLSIVIPAYNESGRIRPYLESIRKFFQSHPDRCEVLVVNDGSIDDTAETVRDVMKSFPELNLLNYEKNRGKGHAVRMGMLAARGVLRLFADADGSTPIAEWPKMRGRIMEEGFDVVVGSRALPGPDVQRKIKPHRYLIGQIFRLCRRVLLKVSVVDSQCGFKLFSGKAADRIFPVSKVDGFAFDVELLFLAARFDFRIAEVAVNWHDDQSSRVNLLIDPIRMLRDMARIRGLHREKGSI